MESMFFLCHSYDKGLCKGSVLNMLRLYIPYYSNVFLAGMNFKSFGSIFTCIMSNILFEKRRPESFFLLLVEH